MTQMELLPLVMDLVEDIHSGKAPPQDVVNDAHRLMQRVMTFRAQVVAALVQFVYGGSESLSLERDVLRL